MSALSRREILSGAAVGAAAATLPTASLAGGGLGLAQRAAALRAAWQTARQDYLDSLFADRMAQAEPALHALAEAVGDGLGAMATMKELEDFSVEDQVHPDVQGLLRDTAVAIARMAKASRRLIEGYLDGEEGDPDREVHLRGALRALRFSVAEWKTRPGRQRALEAALLEAEEDHAPRSLARRLRREAARLARAERLAEQIAAHRAETGLLEATDPAVIARVRGAAAQHAQAGASAQLSGEEAAASNHTAELILGILLLGLSALEGFVLLVGFGCAIACGIDALGVGALLLGCALLGLTLWGGVSLIQKGSAARRAAREAESEAEALGPRRIRAEASIAVLAAEDWVDTPFARAPGQALVARARGAIRSGVGWMADANGNGVAGSPEALVPGAPVGALVGRVGDDRFFLGSDGRIPTGPPGRLQLAINREPEQRCRGQLAVRLGVLEATCEA